MKCCKIDAIHIVDSIENKGPKLEDYELLQEYADVSIEEVPSLLRKRDIDFSINLMIRATSTSKAPYRMSTP